MRLLLALGLLCGLASSVRAACVLKQSTAATVLVGPFVDKDDGITEEAGLASTATELSKAGGAYATGPTLGTLDSDGWYPVALTTSHTDTLGELLLKVHDSATHLPVWRSCTVLAAQVFDSLQAGTDLLQVDPTQLEGADASTAIAAAVWDEAASSHVTAGTFGQRHYMIRAATAQAGSASTITLDASASTNDDEYNGAVIYITAGTGAGQAQRCIIDYDGTTKVAAVGPSWDTNPSSDSAFVVVPETCYR